MMLVKIIIYTKNVVIIANFFIIYYNRLGCKKYLPLFVQYPKLFTFIANTLGAKRVLLFSLSLIASITICT